MLGRIGRWLARRDIAELEAQRATLNGALDRATRDYRGAALVRDDLATRLRAMQAAWVELAEQRDGVHGEVETLRTSLAAQKRIFADLVAAKDAVLRENERLAEENARLKLEVTSAARRAADERIRADAAMVRSGEMVLMSGLVEGR